MLSLQPKAGFSRIWSQRYQVAALWVAAAVALYALLALAGRALGHPFASGPATVLGLLFAALAVLLLAPRQSAVPLRRRALGWALAAALLLLGLASAAHRLPVALEPLPGAWLLCFFLLALSLLAKPAWPRTAVATDMFVGFLGYVVVLERLFRLPDADRPGATPLHLLSGLCVFALSVAWMLSFPSQRPVGYFTETGSAGTLLRRVLPITLLFPVLLVVLTALQRNVPRLPAQLGGWVVMLCAVGFGAALIWIIAASLDRMDLARAAAERDLRLSEERYRLLFENNPEPMWIYDAESLRFLDVNDTALRIYGYTRAEFLALRLPDLAPPGDDTGARRVTKLGRVLEVEAFDQPATWYGRPARVAFVHDVTARRQTDAQLRESEARVRILLETTLEGILAVDAQGHCEWCNPAVARMLGFASTDDLLGKNAHQLFHHSHADGTPFPAADCPMVQAIAQGRSLAVHDETLWRADGSSFPADYCSCPLWRDGHIVGAVVSFSDVSERKALQAQFHQAQKMEAVGRLAAGIAHDFNNLLTVVNGYAEMLLRHPDAPDVATKAANIRKAGERAAGLTQQLLAFSRQQVLQPRVLDLNLVLAEMDPLLRRILGEDLALETHFASNLASVRADPGQIDQVLMNLVVNARDAMPNGGRLTLETANVEIDARYAATHPEVAPGPYVMLAVTDSGIGMDAATLAHIFEPFFTTKPAGQGTGLGLATVFGIVKQSGGSVAAYSEPGRGTSMKVYLPSLAAAAEPADPAAAPAVLRGHETLLVVEDEESVRHLVCEVLEESGYTVLAAPGPDHALALLADYAGPLDLLVTDVVMPGLNGRLLADRLLQLRPSLAILFISGYPDKAIAHNRELEAGLAFIQKPFTPEALARKVRAVLDARPGASAQAAAL